MKTKQQQIIEVWEKDLKHPSYGYIAKKVDCSKTYAVLVIKAHMAKKNPAKGQNKPHKA